MRKPAAKKPAAKKPAAQAKKPAKVPKVVDAASSGKSRLRKMPVDFAARLTSGETKADIARSLHVNRDTVLEWSKLPEVQIEVARIRSETSEEAKRRLVGLQRHAVAGIAKVLESKKCEECGRGPADDKDVLKAAEIVFDRTGMPKTSVTEVSGGLGVEISNRTDAELERDILEEAIAILQERGFLDLSKDLQSVLNKEIK